MTKSKGTGGPRSFWTDAEVQMLRDRYPHVKTEVVAAELGMSVKRVFAKANAIGLKKTAEYLATPDACRLRKGDNVGAASRFKPGQQSWNKGLKGVVGVQPACRATQFKPGSQPHTTLPVGSYRYTKDGTLQQKIGNSSGNNSKRWRAVHELVWIRANGPVPAGHIVVFKPGMRTAELAAITPDRVECISFAENMRRNTLHRYPKEVAHLIQLRAALNRQINKRSQS